MSAPIAKNQFAFELPNLTYIDASEELANLRVPVAPTKPRGVFAWIAAFRAWREKQVALKQLEMLSDRELADIGLSRSDVPRVFDANFNQDLLGRSVVRGWPVI
jgi:uncharacterized protein YjiS (DUF1127 family)